MTFHYLYREQSHLIGNCVGSELTLDSFPMAYPSSYMVREVNQLDGSMPFVIFATAQEEGVDFPFMTRDTEARDPMVELRRRRQARMQNKVAELPFWSIPTPILDAPPTTDPIFFATRLFDYPDRNWRSRSAWRNNLARRSVMDIPAVFPEALPASSYTATVCGVLEEVQRHMLEATIDQGVTWSLWTQTEVLGYLNERMNKMLLETGMIQKRTTSTVSSGIVALPTDLIDLNHVAVGGTGLVKLDSWSQDQLSTTWDTTTGTPYGYVEEPMDPLTIRIVPAPTTAMTMEVIYTPAFTMGPGCQSLPIPAMAVPFLKYGIMADMFGKEGEANDPERAGYCSQRFEDGISMIKFFMGITD